jgi:hypothetical protein
MMARVLGLGEAFLASSFRTCAHCARREHLLSERYECLVYRNCLKIVADIGIGAREVVWTCQRSFASPVHTNCLRDVNSTESSRARGVTRMAMQHAELSKHREM